MPLHRPGVASAGGEAREPPLAAALKNPSPARAATQRREREQTHAGCASGRVHRPLSARAKLFCRSVASNGGHSFLSVCSFPSRELLSKQPQHLCSLVRRYTGG
ncbi:hypothetical protein MTO96_028204 [Rhipicephalus appendiculatus]